MDKYNTKFCFCTLAFGKNYRKLAILLAKDIEQYSPNTHFIVLTDYPQDFSAQANILAFKHKPKSAKLYHDKLFVVSQALSMFNTCIYIDADMRILAPVPQDMAWIQSPGITARVCEVMAKKYAKVLNGKANARLAKRFAITKKAAQKLALNFEDKNVKFVYEYLFAVTRDSGKEIEFLKQWEILAPYFELNGVYDGEGNAIGLAAAKAGLPVRWSEMEGISFFKDRTELVRVKKGQSKMKDVAKYFEQQKMIEFSENSLFEKLKIMLAKKVRFFYSLFRLRISSLSNFDFYYSNRE
ncbi:MAG TPA: hypothetical protein IGS40_28190 [Trichormus sp. M33_DOE_039]|nr:hypothetical protein [Trichormus sp. M33_DOE_039]